MKKEKKDALFLSSGETANLLGISKSQLNKLVARGEIVPTILPGMVERRFSRNEIENYINRAEVCHG